MNSLKAIVQTYLKASPIQAASLPDTQKQLIAAGFTAPIAAWLLIGDHYKITLGKDAAGNQIAYQGRNTWYAYAQHIHILDEAGNPIACQQTTNEAGLALIKRFEGCVLSAYPDPGTGGDPWTIGYGHTGNDVYRGLVITALQAENLLKADLQLFEKQVNQLVATPISGNQFSALVSFDYNTGSLEGSTLLRLINAGDFQGAADQFLRWTHAGGHELPGLVSRRQAERDLFLA